MEIAEEEPEDVAVRRYMKAVMQSGVINKVRGGVLRVAAAAVVCCRSSERRRWRGCSSVRRKKE